MQSYMNHEGVMSHIAGQMPQFEKENYSQSI